MPKTLSQGKKYKPKKSREELRAAHRRKVQAAMAVVYDAKQREAEKRLPEEQRRLYDFWFRVGPALSSPITIASDNSGPIRSPGMSPYPTSIISGLSVSEVTMAWKDAGVTELMLVPDTPPPIKVPIIEFHHERKVRVRT